METNKVLKEMKELRDLRMKQANELKNKFIELLDVTKNILVLSGFDYRVVVVLKYYYYSENESCKGDERLVLVYEDGDIFLENQEFIYNSENPCGIWERQGGYFEEDLEKGLEKVITNKIAFDKFKQVVNFIDKIVEEEKEYIFKQQQKIEKANDKL